MFPKRQWSTQVLSMTSETADCHLARSFGTLSGMIRAHNFRRAESGKIKHHHDTSGIASPQPCGAVHG